MKKWLILLLVALFSSAVTAGQPKLRGPSRLLNSRTSISSMKDRGKPRVRIRTNTRNRGSLYHRNRRGSLLSRNRSHKDHFYRSPQPIIVIVHVFPLPIPQHKPSPKIVRTSSLVTIFAMSTPNSRRFGAKSGGLIIFPKKPVAKTKP